MCLFIAYLVWENNALESTNITYQDERISSEFENFKIAQISDLHNREFGRENEILIKELKEQSPDIIVITGDLIDSRNTKEEVAIAFVKNAKEIAPVYFVSGNHESRLDNYIDFKNKIITAGAIVLDNDKAVIIRNGQQISLIGISDPDFYLESKNKKEEVDYQLKQLVGNDTSQFTILLSHRPELIDNYSKHTINLVLSGHAHGGQIRFPLIGALFAPEQGLFPKYTTGSYEKEQTTLIVSRGLGNSLIPFRVLNRPQLMVITLKQKQPVQETVE